MNNQTAHEMAVVLKTVLNGDVTDPQVIEEIINGTTGIIKDHPGMLTPELSAALGHTFATVATCAFMADNYAAGRDKDGIHRFAFTLENNKGIALRFDQVAALLQRVAFPPEPELPDEIKAICWTKLLDADDTSEPKLCEKAQQFIMDVLTDLTMNAMQLKGMCAAVEAPATIQ